MNNFRTMGVLKSYVNFQLLDYLLESFEDGDDAAQNIIGSFAKKKNMEPKDIVQCVSCKETTLALLAGMIFFIRASKLPAIEEDNEYRWWENLNSTQIDNDQDIRVWAINIIRNSIAHWGEGRTGVEFIHEATRFRSIKGEIKLKDAELHKLIMQMYRYTQHIATTEKK